MAWNDLGGDVLGKRAVSPAALAAGASSGAAIDRLTYAYCVFVCTTGATGGSPTAFSSAWKVEESADSSVWVDVSGATATIATQNSEAEINVDCTGRLRYLRLVVQNSFTGGSSPTMGVGGTAVLGQSINKPV